MKTNISERHSYGSMGSTCLTRIVGEKRITWVMPVGRFGDEHHRVRVLSQDLAEPAAELWRTSYPEVQGSPHEFLLHADQYASRVAMEDNWENDSRSKVYCMGVLQEISSGKVVAAMLLTKFDSNLQVEFSFTAIHPDYRHRDLTAELRRFARIIAIDSGAEYFTTFCETWHDFSQSWCIQEGWSIAGVFPGNFLRRNDNGQEYRGCAVHFYRYANNGAAHASRPQEWRLAPEVQEVWEALQRVNEKIEKTYLAGAQRAMMRAYRLSP